MTTQVDPSTMSDLLVVLGLLAVPSVVLLTVRFLNRRDESSVRQAVQPDVLQPPRENR